MVSVDRLVPYANNARTHSAAQVDQIAGSIKEWGWTVPVLVDEHFGIIAGHGRVMAAKKLGLDEIPCMVARGWTDSQRRAYVIADNKLAENAGWDDDLLRIELESLQEEGFSLGTIGFSMGEVNDILDTGNLSGEDDAAPPRPDDPVSRLGDVWLLGRHRLICGDSTDPEVVEAVLAGHEPMIMVTDPPYGVEYDPKWRERAGVGDTDKRGVANDDRADWYEAWKLFPGDIAYVWYGSIHAPVVLESLLRADFEARSQIIWKKDRFVLSRGAYHWQHETCLYATKADDVPVKDRAGFIRKLQAALAREDYDDEDCEAAWYAVRAKSKARWSGDRRQSSVWDIPITNDGDVTVHGTQKPLECMGRAIRNHDVQEAYDPFCGSGSTLIASELLGRTCFAVELDPGYVDVVVQRWQNRTGEKAILEATGKPFDATGTDRAS